MLYQVPRTCSDEPNHESKAIKEFRVADAYVLLADPGAGKSVLFKEEANATDGVYLTARDFLTFNKYDQWQGKTLFIDGLDETRAGKDDGRTPLDAIRGKLDYLGRPRFRLSCRAADWLGGNDQTALDACSSSGSVKVLHLDPLSHQDIKLILKNDPRIISADNFMQNAHRCSLEGLLYNPQSLDMLISAVQGDKWPTTKLDTYELATKKLVQEHNSEHRVANNKIAPTIEELLDAAGFLCAVQLLANASEFNVNNDANGSQVCLNTMQIPKNLPCFVVLKTGLFKSEKYGQFQSIHRSVAEYLGARYLDIKIKKGLPLRRVLALMTGFDGGVVAALRGLMAWLSALSIEARDHLIEIDPLGVVLYGDAQLFSTEAKKCLLSALRQEANKSGYLRYDHFITHPFAALTTKDMSDQLLTLLNSPLREKPEQILLNCIMDGLSSSELVTDLKDSLIAIIRDNTYWYDVRVGALRAFIHQHGNDVDELLLFARDLRANKIKDKSNRLLTLLLPKLFPNKIKATEIFDYLKRPDNSQNISNYDIFWNYEFVKLYEKQDIPILLDELFHKGPDFLQLTQIRDLFDMAGYTLLEGLKVFGSLTPIDRLYNWLSVGLDKYSSSHLKLELHNEIKAWVESKPEHYFSILGVGLSRIADSEKVWQGIYEAYARLYNATTPYNIGLWWLEQAVAAKDYKFGESFFAQAFSTLSDERGHQGLSLEYFEAWVAQHPVFFDAYQRACICTIEDWRKEHAQSTRKWAAQHKGEKEARYKYFNDQISVIENGSAYPQVFHHLAGAYFDHYVGTQGKTGLERLSDLLCEDPRLISAAKSGLRKIIYRTDLPQTSEIFALATKHREHYIRLPFLTSMAEIYNESTSILDTLNDDLARKALAFWYTYGAGNEPAWVKPLSLARPELTSRVIIEYASAMLTAKVQYIHCLYQLTHDPEYHEIARITAIRLLKIYPARSSKNQVSSLESLLKAAIQYAEKSKLLELISEKLTLKSLDIAQRVYWLCSGLILEPSQYETMVRSYLRSNVTRINHFSHFLYGGLGSHQSNYSLQPSTIALVIELLAPRCTPYWPERSDSLVTSAMNEGDYVRGLVNRLAENPDDKIQEIIKYLLSLSQLEAWYDYLGTALQTQSISRREALFRYPEANEVALALNNLNPVNVADLAALTMEHLNSIAKEIRTSNIDSYKRLWNVDGNNKLLGPRPENSCRDYLIDKLRPVFSKINVDVQPETHEANDKRADMRLLFQVSGSTYHLPVEIKLDRSPDLWSAIHNQLIPFYTLDPATQGRGLFFVFWFGGENMPSPFSGKKPQNATELEARLIESLSSQEQLLIDIFVLDVSKQRE